MTDGEALLVENIMPVGVDDAEKIVEAWNPYRAMFDMVWSGRRHVMMGASQIDTLRQPELRVHRRPAQPKTQLLGIRGAPGNTINDTHVLLDPEPLAAVFVAAVDVVSGVGYDRAAELGSAGPLPRDPRASSPTSPSSTSTRPTTACACARVHPGVTVDEVTAATGFELVIARRRAGEPAAVRR